MISIKKKVTKELYCQFLIAAQTNYTATDFSSHVEDTAHDAITRFLKRTKLTPKTLWEYTEVFIDKKIGYVICDDTVLDHIYSKKIGLSRYQYSGAHHDVVLGIGVTTLLWSGDNNEHIPFDYRLYDKQNDGKTKNDHFREMLIKAKERGFTPKSVLIDSWYSVSANLQLIASFGWIFVCGLKSNRRMHISEGKNHYLKKLSELDIPDQGAILHMKGYGKIKVFRITKDGKMDYYGTNDFTLSKAAMQEVFARRWEVEEYHRGLKQAVGIEKCQARIKRSQRTHIFCSILSFIALEKKRLEENITWYESKRRIIADSLFLYLKQPLIPLPTRP